MIDGFKASLHGPLLRPGEAGYDDARKIWNGMIDRRPALIASLSWCCRCNQFRQFRTHPRAFGRGAWWCPQRRR